MLGNKRPFNSVFTMAVILAVVLLLGQTTLAADAKPIKLTTVTFIPTNIDTVRYMKIFNDRIKERSKGELTINLLGGPEAIPRANQAEALRNGVVDMTMYCCAEWSPYVPETNALLVSEVTPMEERKRGFVEYMNGQFNKKMNAVYLGRTRSFGSVTLFLKFKVNTLEDLKKKSICTTPGAWKEALERLGANPLVLPLQERYSALERGIAAGSITSLSGAIGSGFSQITKYFIEPTIHPTNNVALFINLRSWNSLPGHLQKLMTETIIEMEAEQYEFFKKDDENARAELIKAGMQACQLEPSAAKVYTDAWNGVVWDKLQRECAPESLSKLKTFLSK